MTNQLESLIAEVKAAAEKATPGEWWSDVVKTGGSHGNGEDCMEGFNSYAVYDQNDHSLLDMTNSTAAVITVEDDGDYVTAWDEVARRNAEFIALVNPANTLALIAALEQSEQQKKELQTKIEATEAVALALRDDSRSKDKRIAELDPIRAAAEKLVRCKGRYHSEQNYRALAALFGVITPDLPPLDGEASKLAVKLPPHKFSECVNGLLEEAIAYAGTQQLRARLSSRLSNFVKPDHAANGTVQGEE